MNGEFKFINKKTENGNRPVITNIGSVVLFTA